MNFKFQNINALQEKILLFFDGFHLTRQKKIEKWSK